MPFESEKQRRWMYANKPAMAREWSKKYNDGGLVEGSLCMNDGGVVYANDGYGGRREEPSFAAVEMARQDMDPEYRTKAGLSGVDFLPIVGDIKGYSEADTGMDYLWATVGLIPIAGDWVKATMKAKDVAEAAGKSTDAVRKQMQRGKIVRDKEGNAVWAPEGTDPADLAQKTKKTRVEYTVGSRTAEDLKRFPTDLAKRIPEDMMEEVRTVIKQNDIGRTTSTKRSLMDEVDEVWDGTDKQIEDQVGYWLSTRTSAAKKLAEEKAQIESFIRMYERAGKPEIVERLNNALIALD